MKLEENNIYHVYNQGNDRQGIFFTRNDYLLFIKKIRTHLLPEADLIAYCLMPNHYHFLIYTSGHSCEIIKSGNINIQKLTNAIRILSSSYTNNINRQYGRSGSLFRQRTKFKILSSPEQGQSLPFICFQYIHQNPLKAKLVKQMEDWEFSSFRDYAGMRNGSLCNYQLAERILDVKRQGFVEESYSVIREDIQKLIF